LTFPRMGTVQVALAAVLEKLGHQVVVPPPLSADTAALGARYAPESACLPCKLVLGGFLQVAERETVDGAIMAGGVGPCRFGCYHRAHRSLMREQGFDWEWFVARPPRGRLGEVFAELSRLRAGASMRSVYSALRLGWRKLTVLDEIEEAVRELFPRENSPGSVRRVHRRAVAAVEHADELRALRRARAEALCALRAASTSARDEEPVQVALVGEIFTVLEPGANMQLEDFLGGLGARVHREIRISNWAREHIFCDFLRWSRKGHRIKRAAEPYLGHFVGGEGQATVGRAVHSSAVVDGIVHVMPFTCGPEIIARSVLRTVRRDLDIPILTLVFDEHTARAGVQTRLEAFVDMLRWRKAQSGKSRNRQESIHDRPRSSIFE